MATARFWSPSGGLGSRPAMALSENPEGSALDADAIARQLRIEIELCGDTSWPLRSSRFVATARGAAPVEGCGAAWAGPAATIRSIAEHVERASLTRPDPPIACVAPWDGVRDEALYPPDFGLYAG